MTTITKRRKTIPSLQQQQQQQHKKKKEEEEEEANPSWKHLPQQQPQPQPQQWMDYCVRVLEEIAAVAIVLGVSATPTHNDLFDHSHSHHHHRQETSSNEEEDDMFR